MSKITGKNIAKFSRGGVFKPKLQAEILQTSQEVESKNQNYRQKYCKMIKRWNLQTRITGKHIKKFQRDTGVALHNILSEIRISQG